VCGVPDLCKQEIRGNQIRLVLNVTGVCVGYQTSIKKRGGNQVSIEYDKGVCGAPDFRND